MPLKTKPNANLLGEIQAKTLEEGIVVNSVDQPSTQNTSFSFLLIHFSKLYFKLQMYVSSNKINRGSNETLTESKVACHLYQNHVLS